jgi:hypothetical protein
VRDEKCIHNFRHNLKGTDKFGDLGVDRRIILKRMLKEVRIELDLSG